MKINNDCCKFLPVTGRNCNELREYSVIKSAAVDEEVKPLFKDDFWYSYWALVICVMIAVGLIGYFVRSPILP